MNEIRFLLLIINFKTIVIATLAVISTLLCQRYNLTANFPLTLIATAIIFPIVFSIGGAYKRREVALDKYAIIKSNLRAIHLVTRDWLDSPSEAMIVRSREEIRAFFESFRTFFRDEESSFVEREMQVCRQFSSLSRYIKTGLREQGLSSGEVSRTNQYLNKTIYAFEAIKHIYQYRTPRTLRAFSHFFIILLPILYGPYFAHVAKDYSQYLSFVMPILFSLIFVSLDNIQSHLENPFDQIGEDDIQFNVEKFIDSLEDS